MNNKFKTIIYPFDVNSISLIRHNNLIKDYKFTHLVSPNGWGFSSKDVSEVDGGELLGLTVESDFNNALKDCDTVLFIEPSIELDFKNIILPKMIIAAESSKNIVCAIELEKDIFNEISGICKKNNKFFKYLLEEDVKPELTVGEEIYPINVPVIFIAGLCERTNKFELQLNLREQLLDLGYNVSQIGTRNYCELMNFHSFPQFMFKREYYEWEKITFFNHYIKKIEINEEPDVIIIGIPGGTMPISERFTNKFGCMAYEVSQAIIPDAVILSSLYNENLSSDYLEIIAQAHRNKFAFDIDAFNISNTVFNKQYSELISELQYITTDYKFISKKITELGDSDISVFNTLNKNDNKKMAEFIVNKLAGSI